MKRYSIYLINWEIIPFETNNIDNYLKSKYIEICSIMHNIYYINTNHIIKIKVN